MEIQEVYFITVFDYRNNCEYTITVDGCDFERIVDFDWWVKFPEDKDEENGDKYACANVDGKFVSLHEFIYGTPPKGTKLLFKDRNKLNVRRNNVKVVPLQYVRSKKSDSHKRLSSHRRGTKSKYWD